MAFTSFPHRKLFQFVTPTNNNDTQKSPPCTDYCDPLCNNNFEDCYSFPDPEWVPPFPSPPPPSSPPLGPTIGYQISPVVIIVIIVLVSVFLVITYYAVIAKDCSNWTRALFRRNRDPTRSDHDTTDRQPTDDLFHDMGDPDPVDHPIWLISTVGLQQSVINSIAVIRYKRGEGLIEGTECSVCLSEFQESETLRLLPKCNHAFHIDCIDTWLRSHTNCPLCRAGIVVNTGRPSLASNEPSFGHSSRVEPARVADSDSSDVELGNGSGSVGSENRGVTEHSEDNNSTSNNDHQNKAEDQDSTSNGVSVLTLVRRSFSMDFRHGSNSRNVVNPNSSSSCSRVIQQPRASPAPIKRSYSWSERVFWSTRNQNRNSDLSP